MERPPLRVTVAVGLVAACTLAMQVLLSRLFSAALFYHFAFFSISLALLGTGAGALAVYVRPAWFSRRTVTALLARWSALLAVLLVAVPAVLVRLDYSSSLTVTFDLVVTLDRMIVTLVSGQIRVTTRQGQAASLTTPGASLTIYAGGTILRRADWGGTPPPDFAALFGSARLADRSSWGTRASPADHRIAIGLSFGGAALVRLPTNSSSGFYTGDLDQGALGLLIGISAFTDVARFGNAPGPFGTGIVSLGIVVDDIIGTALQWKGLCGGAPCDGSGHLNELNVIGEIKLTTPISTTDSANVYVGGGLATLWPTGTPTGAGGPSFVGHASAPAVRVGFGFDRRYSDTFAAGFKVGAQHTFATEFDTTLVGERFRFSGKTEILFAVTLTFSP